MKKETFCGISDSMKQICFGLQKYRGNPGRWRRCDAGKHLKGL